MTDKAKWLELADRCEAATGPDVELDLDIADATKAWKNAPSWQAFRPTASLDAAMTLVPDGAWWTVEGSPDQGYSACVTTPKECAAHTPALALCAAALRARAA